MVSLDTRLSRREVLKLGGITAANLIVPASEDRVKVVTPLIKQRQQVLDRIVALEPSPYVRKVIYDHDGSLMRLADYEVVKRVAKDFRYHDYRLKYDTDSPAWLKELAKQDYEGKTPDFVRDFFTYILFSVFYRSRTHQESDAVTVLFPSDFGKGMKSDIYLFENIFKKLNIGTPQGVFEINPVYRIRSALKHEYEHAEDNYQGIDLGNGLVIDSNNIFNINPRVKKFVMEVNAYLNIAELSRLWFGRGHPLYWFELGQLMYYMASDEVQYIKRSSFTPYETRLIQTQMDKVDAIRPEAKQIRFIERN